MYRIILGGSWADGAAAGYCFLPELDAHKSTDAELGLPVCGRMRWRRVRRSEADEHPELLKQWSERLHTGRWAACQEGA